MSYQTQGGESFIELRALQFSYSQRRGSEGKTGLLLDFDRLAIERGESIAVVGPSGSGKTTLLNLIAGLLTPTRGEIRVGDQRIDQLDERERRAFRIRRIGFIFQDFQLLDYLNVNQNLALPFRIHPAQRWSNQAAEEIREVAKRLRIEPLLGRRIQRLSQGERQRVAIGRALVTRPELILGDEPTGNLDVATRDTVLNLMLEQASQLKATLIVVTHDTTVLSRFDRVVDIRELAGRSEAVDEVQGEREVESGASRRGGVE